MTKDICIAAIICLAVIAVCCVGVSGLAMVGYRYTCREKAAAQGLEHQWGPAKGCLIKVDGKWIDYDKWRIME